MPYYFNFNERRYRSWENFKSEIGKSIPYDKLLDPLQTNVALLSWIYEESPYFDYENVGKHLYINLRASDWLETFGKRSSKPWKEILEEMFGEELFSKIIKIKNETEDIERKRAPGTRKVLEVGKIKYAFRWCPPGEFEMGGNIYPDEPCHKVKLTKGFWMLETEVTQAMWQEVMDESIDSKAKRIRSKDLKGIGDKYPMYYVSWEDCQAFCNELNEQLELGEKVQLPTEAQWEYACRAGMKGNADVNLDEMAWYIKNSDSTTHEVSKKKPNDWGLYDMYGNVWEWCMDYYDENYYKNSPKNDPENTTESPNHVSRGGSWNDYEARCRFIRRHESSSKPDREHGFRILLVQTPENCRKNI